MAPRIFIFSIVLGAEYLFYVKFIATFALTFFGYIISVLGSVYYECLYQCNVIFWQNLASLAKLDSLERLHTIQMEGNPVWSLPDYSNYVVSALPHLKVLDQQEITADLRANSAKWKNSEATVKPKSFIK